MHDATAKRTGRAAFGPSDCRQTPGMHRRGRSLFDCNPQAAACTSPRSNRRLLPISISGRKMSVFGPVRAENAILQEIDVPIERLLADFRWQSIDFVDALNAREQTREQGILFSPFIEWWNSWSALSLNPSFSRGLRGSVLFAIVLTLLQAFHPKFSGIPRR